MYVNAEIQKGEDSVLLLILQQAWDSPGGFVKADSWTFSLEIVIWWAYSESWESAFLTGSLVMWPCWFLELTWVWVALF